MSRKNTFENYLIDQHAKQYLGLDDEMPDDFNNWISELDNCDLIDMAEKWGATLLESK